MSSENTNENLQVGGFNLSENSDLHAWLAATIETERRLEELDLQAGITHPETATSFSEPSPPSEYSTPVYDPFSEEGTMLLEAIRDSFCMPQDTPFDKVREFLEKNSSVIRHLVTLTIPHPDHYLPGSGNTIYEPILTGDAAQSALIILENIMSVEWDSPKLTEIFAIVTDSEQHQMEFEEVLRKHRVDQRSVRARRYLRGKDKNFRREDRARRKRKEKERKLNRGRRSGLSKEVHFSSDSDA